MTIGTALERALSLSAGVVAIAAVAITLYEARIGREHQKVSVWPVADYDAAHQPCWAVALTYGV